MRWQVDVEPDESGAVWMRAVGPRHSLNFRTRAAETARQMRCTTKTLIRIRSALPPPVRRLAR
jgi:hypothetical protein